NNTTNRTVTDFWHYIGNRQDLPTHPGSRGLRIIAAGMCPSAFFPPQRGCGDQQCYECRIRCFSKWRKLLNGHFQSRTITYKAEVGGHKVTDSEARGSRFEVRNFTIFLASLKPRASNPGYILRHPPPKRCRLKQ